MPGKYALKPPFEGANGAWVFPSQCRQIKSFGHFKCTQGHRWTSAHAFNCDKAKICRQACQMCGQMRHAWCLWQNSKSNAKNQEDTDKSHKPHQKHNCERCRRGLPCNVVGI